MRHLVPQLQRFNLALQSGARAASMPLLSYLCARAYNKTCHGFFCTIWHHAACRSNPCKFQQSPSLRQQEMVAFSTNSHPRIEKRVSGWRFPCWVSGSGGSPRWAGKAALAKSSLHAVRQYRPRRGASVVVPNATIFAICHWEKQDVLPRPFASLLSFFVLQRVRLRHV